MPKPIYNDKEKFCPLCKQWLPLDSFWNRWDNSSKKDTYCKSCRIENDKKYPKIAYRRKARYGVTPSQYDKLLQFQNYKCAICERTETKRPMVVDHCHKTGKIRGLLCDGCNIILGRFNDDEEIFKKAIAYLRETANGNNYYYNKLINEPEPPKTLPLNNKSGFIGVSWRPEKNKWRAAKKKKHIGYFKTKEEAIEAYINFIKKVA